MLPPVAPRPFEPSADPEARGSQLSLRIRDDGRAAQERLQRAGVVSDFRPPDVVRIAPVPLYNSFEDVWKVGQALASTGAPSEGGG